MNIVIAECEVRTLSLLSNILESRGHKVLKASNVDEALAAINSDMGAIVVDAEMEGNDDLKIARYARLTSNGARIIITTGLPTDKAMIVSKDLNAILLVKPFRLKQFIEAVGP